MSDHEPPGERIGRVEQRVLRAMDDVVRAEAGRLRAGLDTERQRLREALLRAAREVLAAGDGAAARVLVIGTSVSTDFRLRDELPRGQRVELAARLAHDRVRAAALRLADEIRAMEGDLVAPLARASRTAKSEGLPALRRIVQDAARAGAGTLPEAPGEAALSEWEAELDEVLASARASARDQVDAALGAMRTATTHGVGLVDAAVGRVPAEVRAAVDRSVEPGLRTLAAEVRVIRPALWRRALMGLATSLALALVVTGSVLAMGVGLAAAGALFGAIVLTGTYAPPVGAGFVTASVGTLLAVGFTDLLFNVIGDWREGRDDGLLGAVVPVRATGRLPRALELGPVLEALHLTPPAPRSPTPVPAPYAPFGPRAEDPRGDPTTDPGLLDDQAHRQTAQKLYAEISRDVTGDDDP